MNVYHDFFVAMNSDEWEFFAVDFLNSLGYSIERYPSRGPDGGSDGLVSFNGKIYLVSCKHYIQSGKAVGVNDENSILDRMTQHGASSFIGFYSTMVSTGLDERFKRLTLSGHECIIYDEKRISDHLPKISSYVLQKYGLPKEIVYPLNVHLDEYSPLPCLGCGTDILDKNLIRSSLALICLNSENKLEYLYGCKRCLGTILDLVWVDLYQALHQEQLIGWIDYIKDPIDQYGVASNFYKNKSDFEGGIQQRMFPSNWGKWLPFSLIL